MTVMVRPPYANEVSMIQRKCKRMGLKITTDEIRKVIYATDLVYYRTARSEKEDKP
jgi:hypothetical protein